MLSANNISRAIVLRKRTKKKGSSACLISHGDQQLAIIVVNKIYGSLVWLFTEGVK